jgi:D-sedoheptulose 7-phosphate isomerase|tara:strand:- start:33 stop:617 length:585 start_codon:yes stop_codon:yes gene_type:complete
MEKKENKFIDNYFNDYNKLLLSNFDEVKKKLILIKKNFLQIKKNKKKIIIFGNGGSAAISSHFSVDMTKNANIRCINFNEPDLITCFSNDFGYDNWLSNSIKFYGDKGDILIAISSSGKSKNIINGCTAAKKKKFSKIITLTGHRINNPVMKKGDINLWINSKAYNFIENIHQFWLLLLVDLVIGKTEYLPNTK